MAVTQSWNRATVLRTTGCPGSRGAGLFGQDHGSRRGKLGLNFFESARKARPWTDLVRSHQVEDRKEGLFLGGEVRTLRQWAVPELSSHELLIIS